MSLQADETRRGCLFAIGGKEARREDLAVLERFVQVCGGTPARVVVISTACSEPRAVAAKYQAAFGALGAHKLTFLHQENRQEAENPHHLTTIERADGVFFTGGNQLKLVTTLAGTSLAATIYRRYHAGLNLCGTSAGAAAMSSVMIARGTGRSAARLSAVRMSPGLGFLPTIIVDQHFRERDRFGRLLAAVLCNPSLLGFGLDEDTAFVLSPLDQVSVVGSGSLTIFDGSKLQASNIHSVADTMPASFAGMRMHVLSEGWRFNLQGHQVEPLVLDPPETAVLAAQACSRRLY